MKKYRKKPVTVDAIKWDGRDLLELVGFAGAAVRVFKGSIHIETLEGLMRINPGDYLIKGVKGEFYPCKPDIFEKTYEEVK